MNNTSKRLLGSVGFVVVALMIALGRGVIMAQGTSPGTPAAGSVAPTPTLTVDQVVQLANKASSDAAQANTNAGNVVNNANNAVNTVNELLNFIQAASLFGGILASAFAILGARLGARTLNDYREEIAKARKDLEAMRAEIDRDTQWIHDKVNQSIRALALTQLAEQQLERHSAKAALAIYQQAADLDPDNRAINQILGELYVQDSQLDKGIKHLEVAIANANDYAPAEAALGYAMRKKAEKLLDPVQRDVLYARSEEHFLNALKLDSRALDINGESIQGVLGGLYKRQGRLDQAIARYQEALTITPHKSYPVNNLAILYFMQDNMQDATNYFEQSRAMAEMAIQGNPFDFWARLDRMTALVALGNPEEARLELDEAISMIQTPAPLDSSIGELRRLKHAPRPPEGIDELIDRLQSALQNLEPSGPEANR